MAGKATFSIIGRLVRNAELKMGKVTILNFSVAVESFGADKYVSYIRIVMFGKAADTLAQYLTQGKEVAVDGYMKQDRWPDKNTGANRDEVKHIATSVILLGGKSEGSTSDAGCDDPDEIPF